jgi:hypothetical protein
MASRKSSDKQRREQWKHNRLKALKDQPERGYFARSGDEFGTAGREKMSEVLEEFASPFLEEAGYESMEQIHKVYDLAVAAWNAALLPDDQHEDAFNTFLKELPADVRPAMQTLWARMIARKKAFFSKNRRGIIGFHLTDEGTSYHLQVASTL